MPKFTIELNHFFFRCTFMFLVLILCISIFSFSTLAEEHQVGGSEGWDQSVDYLRWSQSQNFTVGDVLVFSYVKGQHDVYEVNETTYRSCDANSGVINIYDTGNDKVALEQAKNYYFICTTNGHCFGGMKVIVDVKAAGAPPPRPAPSPRSGDESGSNQSNDAMKTFQFKNMKHWLCFIFVAVLFNG